MRTRNVTNFIWILFICLGTVMPTFAQQQGVWDFYEINAQYRGSMKKGFDDLGCALGFFTDTSEGKQVILHACVKNPDSKGKKKPYYSFRVNLIFTTTPTGANTVREIYSWFDGFEAEHEAQVKDQIIILALLKSGSLANTKKTVLRVNNSDMEIGSEFLGGGKRQEYTSKRKGNPPLDGKFFSKVDANKNLRLEKFHLRRDKISVSFVSVAPGALDGKFKVKEPFSKVVFGK